MVYFKPPWEHRLVYGIPGFIDSTFKPEFERRVSIYYQSRDNISLGMSMNDYMHKISTRREITYNNLDSITRLIQRWQDLPSMK